MDNLDIVVHETDEGGYWAEIPAMPGCITEGDTLEETKANIREAAESVVGSFARSDAIRPGDAPSVRVKAIVNGSPEHVYVCTRCLRSGKVTRAV